MLTDQVKKHAAAILERPTTLGTVAAGVCIQLLGEESLDWEPEILTEGLMRTCECTPHPDVLARLFAIAILLDNERFFNEVEVFHNVCATLLDPDEQASLFVRAPSPLEIVWTCTEAQLLLGSVYKQSKFSAMVSRYCGAVLLDEGLRAAPTGLEFADFPDHAYPDPDIIGDETMASAFWQDQQDRLSQLSESRRILMEGLGDQLAELSVLGADEAKAQALKQKLSRAS